MNDKTADRPAEAEFWNFSLGLYGQNGVSPSCIALQDGLGLDVNLVLYASWVGGSGRGRLTKADFAAAEDVAAPWRTGVIEKLRETRRVLKGVAGAEEIYAKMKAVELESEQLAHRRLMAVAPARDVSRTAADRLADARANVALYVGEAGEAAVAPILAALAAVVK